MEEVNKKVFARRKELLEKLGIKCPPNNITRVLAMIIADSDLSCDEKQVLRVAEGLTTGMKVELASEIVVLLYPNELSIR